MKRLLLTLAVLVLALSACSSSSGDGTFKFTSATPIGTLYPQSQRQPAHDFTGELLDGGKTTLAATKGKVVVLNFWAAWCTPCKTETPQFDLLYRKIKSQGVDFLGIDTKDDRGNARSFVKANDISFPIIYDEEGAVALRLGNLPAIGLPFTVLVDQQGRVAAVYVIRLTVKDLQGSIDKLLAER
jgi:peroxiredoxin